MHDHRDVMVSLALENGWKRGIEVGLGKGALFRRLLFLGVDMIGVDMGRRPDRRASIEEIAEQWPCRIIWKESVEAAKDVEDGWADFVFIDAGHSYQAVKADIAAWRLKVREDGWFGGHDYHSAHPGVIRAVDETFSDRVEVLPHWIWRARPC